MGRECIRVGCLSYGVVTSIFFKKCWYVLVADESNQTPRDVNALSVGCSKHFHSYSLYLYLPLPQL
jgi:hypothetical protein